MYWHVLRLRGGRLWIVLRASPSLTCRKRDWLPDAAWTARPVRNALRFENQRERMRERPVRAHLLLGLPTGAGAGQLRRSAGEKLQRPRRWCAHDHPRSSRPLRSDPTPPTPRIISLPARQPCCCQFSSTCAISISRIRRESHMNLISSSSAHMRHTMLHWQSDGCACCDRLYAAACEQCCVGLAVHNPNVLHPSCTGTCYDCSISAFTEFCNK